jgi:hypothetical protein
MSVRARESMFRRLCLNAAVFAHRDPTTRTLVQEALSAAEEAQGRHMPALSLRLGSSGVAVLVTADTVVRVALAPASGLIDAAMKTLERLAASGLPKDSAGCIPVPLGCGDVGLAAWTLQSRCRGTTPALPLEQPVLADCVQFLVDLATYVRLGPDEFVNPSDDAAIVAEACGGELAARVRSVGDLLDQRLRFLPRVLGHRDFWSGNLLVDGGHLTGVIDWSSARAGSLPLLDLLHLRLSLICERTGDALGAAVAAHLLPADRLRGDELLVQYCERMSFDVARLDLEALVLAYWLEALGRSIIDPTWNGVAIGSPMWIRQNVETVLKTIEHRTGDRPGRSFLRTPTVQ